MARLSFRQEACTGCRICELVCSISHFKAANPAKSAIRIKPSPESPLQWEASVCNQCAAEGRRKVNCMNACPASAIRVNGFGAVVVDANVCAGANCSWECISACSNGGIFRHPSVAGPIKCDLCGGEPLCVKYCPTGALALEA